MGVSVVEVVRSAVEWLMISASEPFGDGDAIE